MTARLFGHRFPRAIRSWALICGAALALATSAPARSTAAETTIAVEVDLRDLPKKLVHATIDVPCEPGGKLALWHPKWIPGTHAPCGSNENVAGLRVETPDGTVIPWRRDDLELYRLVCEVPSDVSRVRVSLDTICNQPAIEASGHLTYGNRLVGVVNWATCILYPEGPAAAETRVELSLRLPEGWKRATALKTESEQDGLIRFKPVSLLELVDSPLIAGEHLRTFELDTGSNPPAFFHIASENPAVLELKPELIAKHGRLVREAGALFGSHHYDEYHFLVTCSDELGNLGLEHLSSSLNGVRERDLIDDARRVGWVANLIPHEYVHSWCGKYRLPAGMNNASFHEPMSTRLLWVYEGLTQYLGEVLMVRSGLVEPNDYLKTLTGTIDNLSFQVGRGWRPLDDTAAASRLLRGSSPNWNSLRRGQDYYQEGALLWMEIDATIRARTDGAKSLDDFCKAFLGGPTRPERADPYEFADVVDHLNRVAPHDWETFLKDRVSRPLDALPVEFVGRLGYRLEYGAGEQTSGSGRSSMGLDARHSLGLMLRPDGLITHVIPDGVGDRAGLERGLKILGINDRTFSAGALEAALTDAVSRGKVDLLIQDDDRIRTVALSYADGVKRLALVRDADKPDALAEILKPRAEDVEAKPQEGEAGDKTAIEASKLPKGYVAHRAGGAIEIDGKLGEKDWEAAPWTDLFVDIKGDRKPRPRFETRAKMLWDDAYFYVAATLKEPHVWATLTEHDSVIFHDNDFEVFIDPDGDNHNYYEIEINALNTEWDLLLKKPYRDGGPALNEWEIPGLKKAVAIEGTLNDPTDVDESWSVELAIPWKVLAEHAGRPAPPRDGDQWRVNFSRVQWRHEVEEGKYRKVPNTPEDNWVWSPQGVVDMHRPERWGFVQFSTAKPGGEAVAFRPDPAAPVRDRLMQIYYAQKAYQRNNQRWADRLDPLDLGPTPAGMPRLSTAIETTSEGWRASITFEPEPGAPQTWTIDQDSRIGRKP